MSKPNVIFLLNDHQAYYRHGWDGGVKPKRPYFEEFAKNGLYYAYLLTFMCSS